MPKLPEVTHKDLIIWDKQRSQCCGFLNKKGSQGSVFSKGKWQKRWYYINIDLEDDENYHLEYFHHPDDRTSRQSFRLAGASIKVAGGNSFLLTLEDDTVITLGAESNEIMSNWIETLENVISVANMREKIIHEYAEQSTLDDSQSKPKPQRNESPQKASKKSSIAGKTEKKEEKSRQKASKGTIVALHHHSAHHPSVRIDVDCATIPPGTNQRHQFLEAFIQDLSKYLGLASDYIEILSVHQAPGMEWLTVVEFDLYTSMHLTEESQQIEYETNPDYMQALTAERAEERHRLLYKLYQLVLDESSLLYQGFITSKLDPSYTQHILDESESGEEVTPFSTEPAILAIMQRYKDIDVPEHVLDISHFTIYLSWEGQLIPFEVPNPMILTKRCCAVWQFEVKQALGFMGTMQELWIDPVALIPQGLPKSLSQPIPFQPSVRHGGTEVISASLLKADMTYVVQCDDQREEALNSLTTEEMDDIKNTFKTYDINGDGGISKPELEELVRNRIQERKDAIEERFEEYMDDPAITEEDAANAERLKAQYLQQLRESQTKLLKMFECADINGDGVISFTEFIMAEAWWLRCTINPDKAHLF